MSHPAASPLVWQGDEEDVLPRAVGVERRGERKAAFDEIAYFQSFHTVVDLRKFVLYLKEALEIYGKADERRPCEVVRDRHYFEGDSPQLYWHNWMLCEPQSACECNCDMSKDCFIAAETLMPGKPFTVAPTWHTFKDAQVQIKRSEGE